MQPMHLQVHATNCHLQLPLINFTTILHSWHSCNYATTTFATNDFFISHSKIVFIHDHAHMSH
jgi:hypothetical protein